MDLTNDDLDDLLGDALAAAGAAATGAPSDDDASLGGFLDALLEAVEVPAAPTAPVAPVARAAPPARSAAPAAPAAPAARAAPPPARSAAPAARAEPTEADSRAAAARFTLSSIKDHAKKKGMWAGALSPVMIPDLLGAVPPGEAPPAEEGAPPAPKGCGAEIVVIARAHTPALLKVLDEIVVNATDHAKAHERAAPSQRVTRVDVTFDPRAGRLTVTNDGPGIPVVPHEEASRQAGRPVYVPEVAFSWFLAGSNIEKEFDSVKGGVNGLGAKLAAVHALVFDVETVDGGARRYYSQQFLDRLDVTGAPLVLDLPRRGAAADPRLAGRDARPHTTVSFVPAYEALGYKVSAGPAGEALLGAADAADLDAWLRLRAHQAGAYVGARVAVTYNGVACATTDAAGLARLLLTALPPEERGGGASQAVVLTAQAKAAEDPYSRHPWNVAVLVLPPGRKAGRRAAAQNMTIINGVLSNKGSHVLYLKRQLGDAVEDKLRKATKRGKAAPKAGSASAKVLKEAAAAKGLAAAKGPAAKGPAAKGPAADDKKMGLGETLASVRLVVCGAIPACGGADWTGQRKDELSVPKATLERYVLPASFLRQVGDAVAERILIAAQGAKGEKVVHDKYTRARHAGRAATKRHTYLIAGEGDSAITLLRAGLTQTRGATPPGSPTLDWCGLISLQGVIVNAAREVKELETAGGETINVRSAKLQGNKRLRALADAFGLRYDRAYATPEERATLNYGALLLAVDQDLDGTGKIAALVLVWLYLFWPALIGGGCVGRLMTPLVRVYPKAGRGPPLELYYEEELRAWLEAHPGWAQTHLRPKYYKGLATHDDDEVRRMFTPEAFRRSIYTYTLDDCAKRLFEVYFGPSAALRKEALVTPVARLTEAEARLLHERRQIPVGRVQLDIDTKAYKSDAIKRQIAGGPDGLNPARRKILMGAMMRFQGGAAELKIFQLGGYVADKCFYHHGDASLCGTITYMAQAYPGARLYPLLVGVGQFGSRHGDKAGSPRYIAVRQSPLVRAAFPPADRWHLPYVFEDGERAEPQYFVPVVPMAALESYRIVSEGWNHDSHGRDLDAVLAVVGAFLAGDPELTAAAERLRAEGHTPEVAALLGRLAWAHPLPPCTRHFAGEVRCYRGEPHSFGVYAWDAARRLVTVTELPMGLSTAKYLETLVKAGRGGAPNPRAAFLETVEDRSSAEQVELEIVLREGAFEQIAEAYGDASIDPLEDALMLRASLRPHLNYYGPRGEVLEFGECYLAAVLHWAPLRRDLYAARVARERTAAELRVLEEEAILRYVGVAAEMDLARLDDDEAAAEALRGRGFPPLDSALLHRPEYTPGADLAALVTAGPGAGYDYILNLRERDLTRRAAELRRARLAALRADLAAAEALLAERPVPCASLWRAEIAAFQETVARGVATSWKFK